MKDAEPAKELLPAGSASSLAATEKLCQLFDGLAEPCHLNVLEEGCARRHAIRVKERRVKDPVSCWSAIHGAGFVSAVMLIAVE